MINFEGYISAEDAEKIRKLILKAEFSKGFDTNEDPPMEIKGVLAVPYAKRKAKKSQNDSDEEDWPDVVDDQRSGEKHQFESGPGGTTDHLIEEDVFASLNKYEDIPDEVEFKVYYFLTPTAVIPYYLECGELPTDCYEFHEDFVTVRLTRQYIQDNLY